MVVVVDLLIECRGADPAYYGIEAQHIADHLIANGVGLQEQDCHWATEQAYKNGKADGVKEFAEKIDERLKRYSHLHKYADEARRSTEEFADGTPMEMISVWDVFPLEKWGMVEYETMNTLQENIETIAKERLLTEFEKDFRIITKEMVDADMAEMVVKDTNVLTNADRIRAMSDEELAELLEGDYGNMMAGTALAWLKQPAEE